MLSDCLPLLPPLYGQNPPLSDDVILKPIIDTDCTVCNTHPEIMAKNYGYKVLSGLSWAELATDSNRSSSSVLQADLIYLNVKRGSRKNIIICKLICPLSYTKYCISIVMGFWYLKALYFPQHFVVKRPTSLQLEVELKSRVQLHMISKGSVSCMCQSNPKEYFTFANIGSIFQNMTFSMSYSEHNEKVLQKKATLGITQNSHVKHVNCIWNYSSAFALHIWSVIWRISCCCL